MLQGVHFLDSKLLEFRDLLESGEVITDYNLCFLFHNRKKLPVYSLLRLEYRDQFFN